LDHDGDQRRLSVWLGSEHRDAAHWAERLPALSCDVIWHEDKARPPWEPVSS
jgi:hypothetical protein